MPFISSGFQNIFSISPRFGRAGSRTSRAATAVGRFRPWRVQWASVAAMIALTVSGAPAIASSNGYAGGLDAERAHNVSLAISRYESAADDGNARAMFALGRLYRNTLRNHAKSFSWFKQAAEHGDRFAQYRVGVSYLNGTPAVVINKRKARLWLGRSARRGVNGKAALKLFGLSRSDADRRRWLELAAERGSAAAMRLFAQAYRRGIYGLTMNSALAQEWQRRADSDKENK